MMLQESAGRGTNKRNGWILFMSWHKGRFCQRAYCARLPNRPV